MRTLCIAPIQTAYRGIGREISLDDIAPKKARWKETWPLMEEYFQYVTDTMDMPLNEECFQNICNYYRSLIRRGVPCELIAGNDHPMSHVYGQPLEYLGIDVALECSESLIEGCWEGLPRELLNENYLCKRVEDVPMIVNSCINGGIAWTPCWVYRVLL